MKTSRNFCTIIACTLFLVQFTVCQTSNSTSSVQSTTSPTTENTTSTTMTATSVAKEITNATEITNSTESSTSAHNSTASESTTVSTTDIGGNTTAVHTTLPTTLPTTPTPQPNTWELKNNGTVCLKLRISATFTVDKQTEVKLPSTAKVGENSSCNIVDDNATQILVLEWDSVYKFEVEFELKSDGSQYDIKSLKFEENGTSHHLNESGLTAHKGKSYKCATKVTKEMTKNATISWDDIQFQAFMDSSNKGQFGDAEECSSDTTSDVVPIAVGCALAGLVIVVLIAYLVGRRRSRQKGYQSV